LGVVLWRPSLAIFRPRLCFSLQKHLLDGTLEALAASLTSSAALKNLFDNRRQLEDRVVFALMRNPALPNACFTDALIEGLYDTVLNPALPLFLMEHPERLERIELMLTWLVRELPHDPRPGHRARLDGSGGDDPREALCEGQGTTQAAALPRLGGAAPGRRGARLVPDAHG